MNGTFALSSAFLTCGPGRAEQSSWEETEQLEEALRTLVATGEHAWPQVRLPALDFVRDIARHVAAEPDLLAALGRLRAGDLYLASACARGLPNAVSEFDRAFLACLPALARVDPSPAFADEVRQVLREKLFVSTPRRKAAGAEAGDTCMGAPKIGEYSGRGDLTSWVRMVALRTALNLRRPHIDSQLGSDEDIASRAFPTAVNQELDYLKSRYQQQFATAFREALATLDSQQRLLLRLYYIDGVSSEKLAALRGVSRSTISRSLANLREQVFNETRRILQAQLHLSPQEFESLVGVLRSQIDLSITAVLKGEGSPVRSR